MRPDIHIRRQAGQKVAIALLAMLPWLVGGISADDQAAVSAVKDAKAKEAWLRHGFTGAQRDKIRAALQVGIDQKFVPGGMMLIHPPGRTHPSRVDDVGRLLMLHRNRGQVDGKQLVEPESLQALYRRKPATGRTSYGLGFNVLKVNAKGEGVRVRHTGASGTFAQLDFENDSIFVLLTQASPDADPALPRRIAQGGCRGILVG